MTEWKQYELEGMGNPQIWCDGGWLGLRASRGWWYTWYAPQNKTQVISLYMEHIYWVGIISQLEIDINML